MKANVISAAAIVLMAVSLAQAAHLTACDGGLWGQVDRQLYDSETTIDSTPASDGSPMAANAAISMSSSFSYVEGTMSAQVASDPYWENGIGTAIEMHTRAACSSSDMAADLWSYGNVTSVVPAYTAGIFFLVEGDSGETAGTPVRIQWRWAAQATNVTDSATATAGAGNIYLTRNVMPPVETPSGGVVWSRGALVFTEPGVVEQDSGSFIAQVGDIIGVFNSDSVTASLTGEGESVAEVYSLIEMLASTLPTLAEYPYAPGLVYDPVQNITFLKDWFVAGGPMNWASANDWAQNYTLTVNGITYSNWRLPTTIDAQGYAVGELGYLSSHYGISSAYLGPFANMLDGDYWTSPQFSRNPDPAIAYAYTFSTTYGPAQYYAPLEYECYVIPVFDGPPLSTWCPADFNNDGIVNFADFAIFASYWLQQRVDPM